MTKIAGIRSQGGVFESLAVLVIGATAVLSVITFIPVPDFPFYHTKSFLLALGAFLSAILLLMSSISRGEIVTPPMTLLTVLFLVPFSAVASLFFTGTNFELAFFGAELSPNTVLGMFSVAVFAWVVAHVVRRPVQFLTLGKAFLFSTVFLLILQSLIFVYGLFDRHYILPTTNLIGTSVDFAHFLGLTIVLLLVSLRVLPLSNSDRMFVRLAVLLSGVLLVFQNIVFVWYLALVGSGVLLLDIIFRKRKQGSEQNPLHKPFLSVSATCVLALLCIVFSQTYVADLTARAGTNTIDVKPSWSATYDIALHTLAQSPFFGTGPTTFKQDWLLYRDKGLNDNIYFWNIEFDTGVSTFATNLSTMGVVGLSLLILFLVFIGTAFRALVVHPPAQHLVHMILLMTFVALMYLFLLMLFAVPGPVMYVMFALTFGLFVSLLRFREQSPEKSIRFLGSPMRQITATAIGTIMLAVCAFLLLASLTRYIGSAYYESARVALTAGDLLQADTKLSTALLFSDADRTLRLGTQLGRARMAQIADDTSLTDQEKRDKYQQALLKTIQFGVTATQKDPKNYQNFMELAHVYATVVSLNVAGAYDEAFKAYQSALALYPTNPAIPLALANLEVSRNNYEQAEIRTLEAIALKRNYTEAILFLAKIKLITGEMSEAQTALLRAIESAPYDPVTYFQVGILRHGAGDTQGALDAMNQALTLSSTYANAHFYKGVFFALLGDYESARQALEAVVSLSPANTKEVQDDIKELQAGVNPFTPARLRTLGLRNERTSVIAPDLQTATTPSQHNGNETP